MIKIGIICPSEIAFRRFLPALKQADNFQFAGISIANSTEWYGEGIMVDKTIDTNRIKTEKEKAQHFIQECNSGKIYNSYTELISSPEIDAVYIPLPPALHFKWAKLALENRKHVFVEKPATTSLSDTQCLINLARSKGLALHENYMFIYHAQLQALNDIVKNGEIGEVRLYRITFGFPLRAQNDFRYNKELGGGALIDAGGYTIKYASYLLGDTAQITTAHLNYLPGFSVDMYGSATMVNSDGVTAQLAFGMDCDYKCEIEIWGSKGTITSNRILTAPVGFTPEYTIKKNQAYETHLLPADDSFLKSINCFQDCINDTATREKEYLLIERESGLLDKFQNITLQ